MSDTPAGKMIGGAMPSHPARLQPRRFGAVNWIGVASLARRQLRNGLSDYHYQVLGPVVSSLLYLAVFHVALSSLHAGSAGDMLSFIAPGLVIYAASDKAYEASAATLILDKHERVIVDMLMAPLTALERSIAYAASAAFSGLSVGLAVGLATLIFTPLSLAHIPALLYFAIAGTLMHGLIGTLVGIWAQKWDQYAVIHTFVLLPLSFLSGVFYRVETLPDIARQYGISAAPLNWSGNRTSRKTKSRRRTAADSRDTVAAVPH